MNKLSKNIIAFLLVTLVLLSLSACNDEQTVQAIKVEYTITVQTEGLMPLSDVTIKVFDENEPDNLIYMGKTDKNGSLKFNGMSDKSYFYVITEGVKGYALEEAYKLDKSSEITVTTLKTSLLPFEGIEQEKFTLGSVVCDFEINATNGQKYKLSELLQTKKAVVLNFWYIGCQPCKMEFPYMQESYDKFKDDIEVIAINYLDGTDARVSSYATNMGLTLPMASSDLDWSGAFGVSAYPTTVVIDRYGVITFKHVGSITTTEEFDKIFSYFTADDYKQSIVKNLSLLG